MANKLSVNRQIKELQNIKINCLKIAAKRAGVMAQQLKALAPFARFIFQYAHARLTIKNSSFKGSSTLICPPLALHFNIYSGKTLIDIKLK